MVVFRYVITANQKPAAYCTAKITGIPVLGAGLGSYIFKRSFGMITDKLNNLKALIINNLDIIHNNIRSADSDNGRVLTASGS